MNYAFTHQAGRVLSSRLCYLRSAYRIANLWGKAHKFLLKNTSCMPAGVALPSYPCLYFSLSAATSLHKTSKWRELSSVHLLCVMFFLPLLLPPPTLFSSTFTCSASSSQEPVRSDSAASSSGCNWVDREMGGPESRERLACTLAKIDMEVKKWCE